MCRGSTLRRVAPPLALSFALHHAVPQCNTIGSATDRTCGAPRAESAPWRPKTPRYSPGLHCHDAAVTRQRHLRWPAASRFPIPVRTRHPARAIAGWSALFPHTRPGVDAEIPSHGQSRGRLRRTADSSGCQTWNCRRFSPGPPECLSDVTTTRLLTGHNLKLQCNMLTVIDAPCRANAPGDRHTISLSGAQKCRLGGCEVHHRQAPMQVDRIDDVSLATRAVPVQILLTRRAIPDRREFRHASRFGAPIRYRLCKRITMCQRRGLRQKWLVSRRQTS